MHFPNDSLPAPIHVLAPRKKPYRSVNRSGNLESCLSYISVIRLRNQTKVVSWFPFVRSQSAPAASSCFPQSEHTRYCARNSSRCRSIKEIKKKAILSLNTVRSNLIINSIYIFYKIHFSAYNNCKMSLIKRSK